MAVFVSSSKVEAAIFGNASNMVFPREAARAARKHATPFHPSP
jgi:hypothetical protein